MNRKRVWNISVILRNEEIKMPNLVQIRHDGLVVFLIDHKYFFPVPRLFFGAIHDQICLVCWKLFKSRLKTRETSFTNNPGSAPNSLEIRWVVRKFLSCLFNRTRES